MEALIKVIDRILKKKHLFIEHSRQVASALDKGDSDGLGVEGVLVGTAPPYIFS